MYKKDAIKRLYEMLLEVEDSRVSEETAEIFLDSLMEDLKLNPPCLPGEKCQKMMHKYIDPQFHIWEEEFDEDMK